MRNGRQRIYGGSGALPVWVDFIKEVLRVKKYENYLDPFDLNVLAHKKWPLLPADKNSPVLVDLLKGTILKQDEKLTLKHGEQLTLHQQEKCLKTSLLWVAALDHSLFTPKPGLDQT